MRFLAGVVVFGLAGACDGKAAAPFTGSGDSGVTREAGDPVAQVEACTHFVAVGRDACSDLPTTERERRRALFQNDCMRRFTMVGNGATPSSLEACAKAIEAAGCRWWSLFLTECDMRGTLGAGAACFTSEQCASGLCKPPMPDAPCGQCTPPLELGDPCPESGCVKGVICAGPSLDARVCQSATYGAAGAPCDGSTRRCQSGLHCTSDKRCRPLAEVGGACPTGGDQECSSSEYCGPSGRCTALSGRDQPCDDDRACAAGLVCATSQRCEPVIWRKGGEPCGDGASRCMASACVPIGNGPMGTCPAVAGAGASCHPFEVICDADLFCFEGTCRDAHAIECK